MAWTNADGLEVLFGQDWAGKNFSNKFRALNVEGHVKSAVIDIEAAKIPAGTVAYPSDLNNDGTVDGFTTGNFYVPAYGSLLRAILVVTEAFTGGTSITVGTYGLTGSAIAANGIVTATEGAIANLDTIGKRVYGAGALMAATAGTASVGAADAYLAVAVVGTFTAGKAKLILEYVDPLGDTA